MTMSNQQMLRGAKLFSVSKFHRYLMQDTSDKNNAGGRSMSNASTNDTYFSLQELACKNTVLCQVCPIFCCVNLTMFVSTMDQVYHAPRLHADVICRRAPILPHSTCSFLIKPCCNQASIPTSCYPESYELPS
jgi:hypothetical protein